MYPNRSEQTSKYPKINVHMHQNILSCAEKKAMQLHKRRT